ncbi:wolframin-like [Gadus macrocephalus]|uniref:wolframin-like n=1 Tax=Gadus macrocephalus TaxID=80720 RepID=UPI0028CB4BBB|nr:wolframin-like [Gadus macrocephalus]
MDSLSPLDVDDIEQMSAVIPSNNKSSSESNAAPVPPTSTSPNPSHTACPEPHAVIADLPLATTMSPKAPAKRTFAAIAKKVIIQERFRKAEEEDAADEDDEEEPEEKELTLEQLEGKAQAGDARAQTQLGQHYLIVAEERDTELNNSLAVRWLLKAAKQGRRGAARLLQRCWIQNKGISPDNEDEVRRLSTESKFELAVRKAAMLMYWKLNPDRKPKVAMTELLENVSQVNNQPGGIPGPTAGQTQKILQSMVSNRSQDLVDLDDFVEITKQFAQGMAAPASPPRTVTQENKSKVALMSSRLVLARLVLARQQEIGSKYTGEFRKCNKKALITKSPRSKLQYQMDSQDPGEGLSRISTADGLDSDAVGFCVCACVCTHVCVSVCVHVFMQSPDPLPQPGRKTSKGSWGLAQGGMMLNSRRSGALIRAMALRSNFMMLQYPLHIVMEVKEHLVDWASRAGVLWLSTLIPTQHVNALIFFFIISNLTVDLFAFVIPLVVFYMSFISMIFCTLRVFQRSKMWENFSTLTALLTRFEPGLDVEQAESNFSWNNLEPHLYFILSVFFVIFSFPVADKIWIPCSELATVAIFFFVISYLSLSPAAATYARRAMVIEVASSLCYLTRFLPEKMAIRILGRTFATLPLGESVVLKLSLPCLLYVYLFYLFFR